MHIKTVDGDICICSSCKLQVKNPVYSQSKADPNALLVIGDNGSGIWINGLDNPFTCRECYKKWLAG